MCAVRAICVPLCATVWRTRDTADDGGRSVLGRAAREAASEAHSEDADATVRAAAQEVSGGNEKELAAVLQLAASSRKAATAEQVKQYEENIRSALHSTM